MRKDDRKEQLKDDRIELVVVSNNLLVTLVTLVTQKITTTKRSTEPGLE